MKILYAAYRHDPLTRSAEIGADAQFLDAIKNSGAEVRVVGPFTQAPLLLERIIKNLYKALTKKRYIKYDISNSLRASRAVSKAAREWQPDLIFSLYPPPLAFYNGTIPCVFRTDATFIGSQLQSPEFQSYGNAALKINIWMESKVIRKSARVITHSEWVKQSLINDYRLDPQRIAVYPNPASLPVEWLPVEVNIQKEKEIKSPLRLLFIGRDPYRKGLDVATQTIEQLNQTGMPAVLHICGLSGASSKNIIYEGNLNKADDTQRNHYLDLLSSAHLLLHPARFDPSPRVTSEAAAFGTPTITNDVGGLATTVKDGESGIVLPRNSPPEAYAQTIRELINQPERYYALCKSTRARYEKELSREVAGKRLNQILKEVAK